MSSLVGETELTRTALEIARLLGWRTAHFRPAQTGRGWRTAVQGDGAGFPDLVLARPPRLVFAELKSETGRVHVEQQRWLNLLEGCTQVETYLWRPADRFEEVLR